MGPRAYARPCACCGNVHTQDFGEMSVDSCYLCKKSPICGFCAWRIPYVCCSCTTAPRTRLVSMKPPSASGPANETTKRSSSQKAASPLTREAHDTLRLFVGAALNLSDAGRDHINLSRKPSEKHVECPCGVIALFDLRHHIVSHRTNNRSHRMRSVHPGNT